MVEILDVFVISLPKITAAIRQGEYQRGGQITTSLSQVAVQLEYKDEVFISGILDNACYQLYQTMSAYNVPPAVVDEVNAEVAGYVAALSVAYKKQELVHDILRDIAYSIIRFQMEVRQSHLPRQDSTDAGRSK